MAYDKDQRHEYYINYVKKGLKKGRGKKTAQSEEDKAASERKSTKGLNTEGKAAAKQVRQQINAERKEAYNQLMEGMRAKIKEIQERIKQAKSKKNSDLPDGDILNMSNEDAEALKAEIEQLRADTKAEKAKIKADYEEKYLSMLDEIKDDSDFKAVKKSKKKKGKKKK